jgi:ligand-binding sensor domain-containing protein
VIQQAWQVIRFFLIYKDLKDRLWFSTGNGLSVFKPSTQRFINYDIKDKKADFWDNVIWILTEDTEGNFWGLNGNNLLFFDNKTKLFTTYKANAKDPDALPANGYSYLSIDRSGTLWVGTAPQGLYWVNDTRSKFIVYKNEPGQPHYFPGGGNTSFAEDKDGTFWLSSANGLYHWYPSSDSFALIKVLKDREESNFWHFSSILRDSKGIVWCTPHGKGLFGYNPKTGELKHFENNPKDSTSLSNNFISCLFEDDEGTLWIGTWGSGLCRFNRETRTFKQYPYIHLKNNNNPPDNHTLNDAVIYTICEDKHGELWLGTNSSGVSRFNRNTGTFTPYQNQWLNDNVVVKIFEDSKENIWMATHASGLFMHDPKTNILKKLSEKDGFCTTVFLASMKTIQNIYGSLHREVFRYLIRKQIRFPILAISMGCRKNPIILGFLKQARDAFSWNVIMVLFLLILNS